VRKVLFVTPDLQTSAARQLVLLVTHLPREQFQSRVCILRGPGPPADLLRGPGVEVEALGWKRLVDLAPFLRLRNLIHGWQPDVIHVWRLPALRLVALLRGWQKARVIVSRAFTYRDGGRPSWWDRRLLRWADAVVAGGPAEAARLRRMGVAEHKVIQVPPGIGQDRSSGTTQAEVCRRLNVPETARLVVGVGPLERNRGFYDAVWTLDILKPNYPDLHLILTGGGPDRERLLRFAQANQTVDRVRFVDEAVSSQALMAHAEIGWAPDRAPDDAAPVLEMMAAGLPVVASRLPVLAEVVGDGETGVLIRPGDRGGLARQTRRLLEDAGLRRRLGEAGRQRILEHFNTENFVQRHVGLYTEGSITRDK
jgi:glycosyltransferase involved in cell wall biosynthesis